jgi:hypothetical protein
MRRFGGAPPPRQNRHMSQLVPFRLADGSQRVIPVEVDEDVTGVVRAARPGELTKEATQTLEGAIDAVAPAASMLITKLRAVAADVDSVEVEFGLKLSGEVGAIIAKTSVEANFTVKVTWKARE